MTSFQAGLDRLKQKPVPFAFVGGTLFGLVLFGLGEWGAHQLRMKQVLRSDDGKSLYSLGQLYARRIDHMKLSQIEAEVLSLGFLDWAGQRQARVDSDAQSARLQQFMETRRDAQTQLAKKEGQKYLRSFLNSGGTHSLSGLAYRVITSGSQIKPNLKDWVEVKYHARLIDGRLIDGTSADGKTVKLPMNGVISGWREGLQLIGEGGEIELVVPSDLAYGDAGNVADVPPGATLVFRIQLVHVLSSDAKS